MGGHSDKFRQGGYRIDSIFWDFGGEIGELGEFPCPQVLRYPTVYSVDGFHGHSQNCRDKNAEIEV